MTHVVIENCIKCKHTDCVVVCPVDCFYEGPNFLVINPDECIDCGVCIDACPVDAIVEDNSNVPNLKHWIELNDRLSRKWPNITAKKDPLPDAEKWNGVADKIKLLEE